ncbi:LysR family transcriptional regulator [uncultured Maritimibacter sp.]|jgi:DNA-binding transcriptional LysR family regulator|uniref:LysR family transcriptional regulator n=1 Tax=uncultured Maritimibacter sp. TaxID=991866 RepID=UPI000AD830B8|nr:LysR family transcriptional regulator [uncultured Maritimibacter sp.]
MRFKQLDLNLLVALDHLLALQSVSAAADRMNMSQSAMSNALSRLRHYFDDPLLVQVGRRMELTPRAEAVMPAIRDILTRVEATIQTAPEFDPARSTREFRMLISDYTMSVLMPHVLSLAAHHAPNVRFQLLPQTLHPHTLLDQGEADLFLAPSTVRTPDHPQDEVFEDRYVCAVWKDGKFGRSAITPEEFTQAAHVVMVPPNSAASAEASMLGALGVDRQIAVESFSFTALPHLVVGTDMIATVHGHIARLAAASLPITVHPLPFDVPTLKQGMQWHTYRSTDPGLMWLRGIIVEAGRLLPPLPF